MSKAWRPVPGLEVAAPLGLLHLAVQRPLPHILLAESTCCHLQRPLLVPLNPLIEPQLPDCLVVDADGSFLNLPRMRDNHV